eukprot:1160815-Pelagomonas_calceolata.AAC.2
MDVLKAGLTLPPQTYDISIPFRSLSAHEVETAVVCRCKGLTPALGDEQASAAPPQHGPLRISEHPCTPSAWQGIVNLIKVLQKRGVAVYLISGSFRELILPLAKYLGVPKENGLKDIMPLLGRKEGRKGYMAVPACGGSLAGAKRACNQTSPI